MKEVEKRFIIKIVKVNELKYSELCCVFKKNRRRNKKEQENKKQKVCRKSADFFYV